NDCFYRYHSLVLLLLILSLFFFYCSGAHRDLHSFPTRRSSDLVNDRGGIILDRTVFYATSGGQPGDTGRMTLADGRAVDIAATVDRKSTRLNSSHVKISYAVFCLKKKKKKQEQKSMTMQQYKM